MNSLQEYFCGTAGNWNREKTQEWIASSKKWLEIEHGEKLMGIALHLDEQTPHLHAYIFPTDADRKLCAARVFGKIALRRAQTTYAQALEHLGIERGVEGSKATHTRVQEFYKHLDAPIKTPSKMEMLALATGKIPEKIVILSDKATAGDLARKDLAEAKKTIAALEEERAQLRKDAASLRTVELADVMRAFKAKNVAGTTKFWLPLGDAEKKENTIMTDGRKFVDGHDKKGTGAVDLVMRLGDVDFYTAIRWLAQKFGTDRAENDVARTAADEAREKAKKMLQNISPADLEPVREKKIEKLQNILKRRKAEETLNPPKIKNRGNDVSSNMR